LGTGQFLWGLFDSCRNSDSESVNLFTWNPVPSDYNFLLAGNLENGDPSIDYNGDETGSYAKASMKGNRYNFDYCIPLLSGNMPFGQYNEYELHNGGPFGDLYCYKDSKKSWQPRQTEDKYDRTKRPRDCPGGTWTNV